MVPFHSSVNILVISKLQKVNISKRQNALDEVCSKKPYLFKKGLVQLLEKREVWEFDTKIMKFIKSIFSKSSYFFLDFSIGTRRDT